MQFSIISHEYLNKFYEILLSKNFQNKFYTYVYASIQLLENLKLSSYSFYLSVHLKTRHGKKVTDDK